MYEILIERAAERDLKDSPRISSSVSFHELEHSPKTRDRPDATSWRVPKTTGAFGSAIIASFMTLTTHAGD